MSRASDRSADVTLHRAALTAAVDDLAQLAADDADRLDLPVAACPGWTVDRVLRHLARVQSWATGLLGVEPGATPPEAARPGPEETTASFVRRAGDGLLTMLDHSPVDRRVPGFTGDVPVSFWWRRMAHEACIHRWDARSALRPDEDFRVEPDFAVDGIDEVAELMLPTRFDRDLFAAAGDGRAASLHLHATDVPGEWMVRIADDGTPAVTSEHAKGDVAVRAPAVALYLLLWNRCGTEGLEVFGDASLLDRFRAAARF